jgi:hypothetical protein
MAETAFGDALAGGAILTGFCGTFLSFRIQREANYYRQVALNFVTREARDVPMGLSHFSAGFLILILASIANLFFGTALPLLGLSGLGGKWITMKLTAAGLFGGLALLVGYFWIELIHYNIVPKQLLHDTAEWKREGPIVIAFVVIAAGLFFLIW